MKSMKFLLQSLCGTMLTAGSVASIIPFSATTTTEITSSVTTISNSEKADISRVPWAFLSISADSDKTCKELNYNSIVVENVENDIHTFAYKKVFAGEDFYISNDYPDDYRQRSGRNLTFTVRAQESSTKITGSYKFSVRLT